MLYFKLSIDAINPNGESEWIERWDSCKYKNLVAEAKKAHKKLYEELGYTVLAIYVEFVKE